MHSTKVTQDKFSVIGLQVRTSNAKEMAGAGNISALWQKFYSENISAQIKSQIDATAYGVYHNYESDMQGEYTLTIGLKVPSGTVPPAGLVRVDIPRQTYAKITTDQGEMPGIVIDGWKHIWQQTLQGELKRKYSFDFELYDHRCADMSSAQLDIYIALM